MRKQTGYGRQRLSRILWQQQRLELSPHTIRHIPEADSAGKILTFSAQG